MVSSANFNHPLLPIAVCLMLGMLAGFSVPVGLVAVGWLAGGFTVTVAAACMAGRWPLVQSALILLSVAVLGLLLSMKKQQAMRNFVYDSEARRMKAVVASEPAAKPKTVAVDLLIAGEGRKVKAYFEKNDRSVCLKPGDGLTLTARIQPCAEVLGDGFRYRRYMEGNGFSGQCFVAAGQWRGTAVSMNRLPRMARVRILWLRLRHLLLQHYRLIGAGDDSYAVLAAMTLGDKSALSKDLREVYSVTGASHVLALSGLHLGILYMLLSVLTLAGWRWRRLAQALIVVAIWAFALLTGLSVSVVRSAVMISVFAVFSTGHRSHASLNLLCLSAVILLCANPYALLDVGFQLSFAAVLSILLFEPLFSGDVSSCRLWNVLKSTLTVSLAAQLGVAPLLAFYFGRFATYFLLTNLIVLPAAYVVLYGTVAMLLLPWPPLAAGVVWVTEALNQVLSQMNRWPLASIEGLHPSVLQVIVYYLVLACVYQMALVWQGRRQRHAIRWDV